MGLPHSNLSDHLVGKRLIRDAYNKNGVLLVGAGTVLNKDHIQLLYVHHIELEEQDLENVGPFGGRFMNWHGGIVDEAIMHVRTIFQEARYAKKVSLAEIRNRILPLVIEITSDPHLFDLFAALQSKNDYVYRHSFAVGVISSLLGKWLGLPETELLQLTTAALLHDIGKMHIPEDILNKPGQLTNEEFEQMKRHTVLGYGLLNKTVGTTHRQATVALQHHERLDGSGYPFGIVDSQIDLFSRIVAVADVFHAMSADKVYRTPSTFFEVLYEMERCAFGELDPGITHLLINKNMRALVGREVVLSGGERGKIVMINPHAYMHPLVQAGDKFIDLSKDSTIRINQVLY